MKKRWESPRILVQEFVPNEYVAACWKINCNVPYGFGYIDNNDNDTYDALSDTILTTLLGASGCGTYHIGVESDSGPVANAMWHSYEDNSDYAVFYWSEGSGTSNQHFSKVEDAEWESNPNAS